MQSRNWSQVVNEAGGFMARIDARPGSKVNKGQILAEFQNPDLELELAAARASKEEMQARLLQAMRMETANLKPLRSKLAAVDKRIARIQTELANLIVRSRQDGIWVAPSLEEGIGRWLAKGTSMGLIVDPTSFEFVATVLQDDVDQLFANARPRAEIRVIGQAEDALTVTNFRKIPAEKRNLPSPALGWAGGGEIPVAKQDPKGERAAEPFFEVRADIQPSDPVALVHGRTGKIRFDLEPEPLLPRAIRRLRQLLQKRYQI
jgi:putative peptide zinc metalloprotease protein